MSKSTRHGRAGLMVKCPTCGKPVSWHPRTPWRPFCSERCRLIDLGAWLAEDNRIPGSEASDGTPYNPEE
jgi:endogenous inhibitor of DNA gyrase (YacG/DUF329 family)